MRLGIDMGTTRTVVACADRGNYPIVSFLDEAGDAHDHFPSLVAERDGELRFGWDAAAALGDPSFRLLRSFKRFLSDPRAVPDTLVRVGGLELPLGDLVTRFALALRGALATRSNLATDPRDLDDDLRSVVAVPANSFGAQRFVTLDAFRRAGFGPASMLNEPSAAGFEYTHRHRDTLTSKRDHVVVYDLGGGTFDASLVQMRGKRHEVVATAGINQLGGDDFDDVLVDLILGVARTTRADLSPRALERLVDQCRDAKERLNPSSRKIAVEVDDKPVSLAVADFYDACGPLVERSIDAMAPLVGQLEDELAGLYVVGGASELPIVARALRARFGRRVHRSPYPSAAIAIGLAIACDDDARFELSDRYARTFGVFREAEAGSEITFDPIFTPGTELPARAAGPVLRRRDYRAAHNVGHFRFFECSGVGNDGRPRGDMTVSGDVIFPFDPALHHEGQGPGLGAVPVRRRAGEGDGPRIEEEYSLDEHGIVAVTIRNVDVGYERVFKLGA